MGRPVIFFVLFIVKSLDPKHMIPIINSTHTTVLCNPTPHFFLLTYFICTISGTQRLPRLVGLAKSLEMILVSCYFFISYEAYFWHYSCFLPFRSNISMQTSKPVKGEEAVNLGLVDAVVPSNQLLGTARKWALDILECRKPWVASLHKTDKIEPLGEAREIFKFARVQTRKQAPNLQHPLVVIDVIEEGIVSGPRAGLWKVQLWLYFFCAFCLVTQFVNLKKCWYFQEAEAFQALLHSDTCKALVNVFFAQRATTKVNELNALHRNYCLIFQLWCKQQFKILVCFHIPF